MPPDIQTHTIRLEDLTVTLRPLSSADWPLLIAWNSNPDVVAWADAEKDSYTEDDIYAIYSEVSRTAQCFIIERRADGVPVGECWLQRMNLARYNDLAARLSVRRIDIMIGLPDQWGLGFGRRAIGLLVDHAFNDQNVDALLACDILPNNARSLAAFRSQGFREVAAGLARPEVPEGVIDLICLPPTCRGRVRTRTAAAGPAGRI